MEIDPRSPLPLHVQIERALESLMAGGTWLPGTRLPSEGSLIERFAVSRTTIRTAIQSLIARGFLEIRRGRGTFVVQPQITQELTELTGFGEGKEFGREASARFLDRKIVAASETVARALALSRGAAVVRIQRVRLADGSPLSFDETYMPQELGEKILADEFEKQPMFSLLEQKYAARLCEAEYRMSAVAAHGTAARALGIETGSPIFLIERTTYSERLQPVDYERLYYRGDHIRFVTRLARGQSAASRVEKIAQVYR
jgi:GntR family transcriptional regulator